MITDIHNLFLNAIEVTAILLLDHEAVVDHLRTTEYDVLLIVVVNRSSSNFLSNTPQQ